MNRLPFRELRSSGSASPVDGPAEGAMAQAPHWRLLAGSHI